MCTTSSDSPRINRLQKECELSNSLCKALSALEENPLSNLLDVALSTAKELHDMLQEDSCGVQFEQAHEKERHDADIRKLAGKCEAYRDVIWMILDKR